MTLVKSDIPDLLTAGLKTAFFQTFGETPAQWDKIATTIPSEQGHGAVCLARARCPACASSSTSGSRAT